MELPALNAAARLWWLLAVLPVLFWLAQPPRPRRVLVTAHRSQWLLAQAALQRRPARFRALRWLLLSLAAVGGVMATAEPTVARGTGPARLVVLLDGSASMARRIGAQSAFELAVAQVRRELANVPDDVTVEVLRWSNGGLARWSGAAARALADPGRPGGELPALLSDLAVGALSVPDTAVWVVTDVTTDPAPLPAAVAVTRLGGALPADNAAIAAVAVDDRWPAAALHLDIDVASFATAPLHGAVRVRGAIAAAAPAAIELAPGGRVHVAFDLQRAAAGGDLVVALDVPGDQLALDDVWSMPLPALPVPRIAVQADEAGAGFARKAARALADAVGAEVVAAAPGEQVGFLITEGGVATLPAGTAPLISFGTAAAVGGAVWPAPQVADWARAQPLLVGLDLSELVVDHALRDALPPGEPLLLGTAGSGAGLPAGTAPLAVVVQGPQATSVHFAFRLQDSNLGLLPALPQLLLRAYRLGHGRPPGGGAAGVPTAPLALVESDLRPAGTLPATGPDRPLPPFWLPARDLGPWCLLASLALLAIRAGLR